MRAFARPFPLQRLSLEARVLYAGFCIFMLVGIGTSFWLAHDDGFGVSPETVRVYYRGDAAGAAASANVVANDVDGGGPALSLPAEATDTPLRLEKSARQVVETFHFHAFSMPVCLLVVGHLFMMCAWSVGRKVKILVAASLSTMLHLLLPVFIRFGGDGASFWAALFVPSAIVMAITWTLMLLRPLVELARTPAEPVADEPIVR